MSKKSEYIFAIDKALETNAFIKLILSKPRLKSSDLKKLTIKKILIKNKDFLNFVYQFQTKDVTKNLEPKEALGLIEESLGNEFLNGSLFTAENDINFQSTKKGNINISKSKASLVSNQTTEHNKEKNYLVKNTKYLQKLGILQANGKVVTAQRDKYRQIQKFVEIIDTLIEKTQLKEQKRTLSFLDMGSGKAYLSFALYDYFVNEKLLNIKLTGVEIRQDLIDKCNAFAKELRYKDLSFELGFISDYNIKQVDVLIALHACDTATDDAIYAGINANAEIIVCAPCCHKQIRKDIASNKAFSPIFEEGIFKERIAEITTDSIRSLILMAHGYDTKVFEFISREHTSKNIMIAAVKSDKVQRDYAVDKIHKIKKMYGIKEHYLEKMFV